MNTLDFENLIMPEAKSTNIHCFDRKFFKKTSINKSISVFNRKSASISILPLLIATAVKLIFVAIFLGHIQGVSSENNSVCIFDRYTKLKIPISFAECPLIESRSSRKNGANLDDQNDVDLKYQWIFRYIDELTKDFKVMFRETSFDEKISNLIYVKSLVLMFDNDLYKINLGSNESDRLFEQYSAGKRVDDQLCGRQLASMLSQLKELNTIIDNKRQKNETASSIALEERHIRLARVLESFGRYDSGAFIGRSYFLGSYLQCSGSQMILDNDKLDLKTSSRYCTARLKIDKHLSPQIRLKQRHYLQPELNFVAGICLPESCHTKSFADNKKLIQELVNSQFKLPTWLYMDENLDVEKIYCLLDSDSYYARVPFSGWFFILFIISWTCLVVVATILKHKYANCLPIETGEESWLGRAIDSLDLSRSWENFKKKKAKEGNHRVQLNVLNPIKVIGCIGVVFFHSLLGVGFTGNNTLQAMNAYESSTVYYLCLVFLNVIDTFFTISGLMVTYFVVKRYSAERGRKFEAERGKAFIQQWFSLIFARYLRLLPAYYLVFWFTKSLVHLIGSGPIWDFGSNKLTMVGGCRHETWFSPFILTPAFDQPNRQCMPQAWTIANDLFLCTFLSPLILLLPKKPNLGLLAMIVVGLSSIGAMVIRIYKLPESLLNDMKEMKADAMARIYIQSADIYIAPYFRAASFLIGSISGYFLFKYNQSPEKQWPKWFIGIATKLSWLFILALFTYAITYPILVHTPLIEEYKINQLFFGLGMTLFRILWCTSNSILFMRMTTDWKHNRLMKAFSGRFWRAMSKLNYGLLLVHLNVIIYHLGTGTIALDYFTINRCFLYLMANYMMSILFALILHVGFESPIDHFAKLALYSQKKESDLNELNNLNSGEKVERILIATSDPTGVESK